MVCVELEKLRFEERNPRDSLETAGRVPGRRNFVVKSTRECTVVKSLTSTNQLTQLTRFENLLVSQLLKKKKNSRNFMEPQLVTSCPDAD